ncbi:hypothetical protein [Cystobacter ferrugineus]|uniref:Uncharacterized protein n=1 Tax=Cystobacter ferrugineus TaxID=83449 RepID=A0A1L9B7G5_9BACT|nr:hypothetical protein [Cystobacter ferrugineus]OJH38181.1 hypothetical protein BON30_23820 [Cystobacter ferrugineus]
MERTRAAAPARSEESALPELASVESGPRALPLRKWVDTVASPGVTLGDVDELLARVSGPLAEGESPRERADQLLHLLRDEALGGLHGKDGREVRPAALEALLSLGYPYALEVPPEVLERMRGFSPRVLSRASRWGVRLAAMSALWPPTMLAVTSTGNWWSYLDGLVILAGVMFLPAVVSALAERYRLRWLKSLCNGALGLMGSVGILLGSLMLLGGSWKECLFTLPIGLAMLSSSICLRHREELAVEHP